MPLEQHVTARLSSYGFAVALVVACGALRWLLDPVLADQGWYLAFVIAVAASAYLGGVGPGVASAVLSAIVAASLMLRLGEYDEKIATTHLLLFALQALGTIWLMARLRRSAMITEHALASAEAARAFAVRANDAQEQILARVSHEWRTPLSTISGWLWQLERRAMDHAFVQRATASMRRAVDTQTRLAADLLDHARGARGKLSMDRRRLTIAEPVRDAVDAVAAEAAQKHLTIHVLEARADTVVWGDPVRLEQVFANLLQNATKFTPCGGTIAIAFARSHAHVQVAVTDTGVGLAPEALRRIFDPFIQTDERRDIRQGGLGLGLSIAREIVQLHGGSLTAWSPGLGMGSSFCVRLPLAIAEPGAGMKAVRVESGAPSGRTTPVQSSARAPGKGRAFALRSSQMPDNPPGGDRQP